ncbi:oligosaccharide flippase family protein [Flaviramulus sp. BrNp1-15]|uniref:lipopolysaccharide biosynthesis protein n=1 Tax=Flaviramulus sp. BrNp1-15 TaxID=2916754 RepID=UPI001EE8C4C6|nr:oligosaccharide flippase family protein [Flaviramulus sp. BrNp1-15]ULC58268.1 oligosaccharide flippase family protein [Flaviramulus sp. BrNp1-15]
MSQIKKGAVLNYVTIFLTNVIGILLTPFIIRKLGDAEYGVYVAIGAVVGTISVLDFGLNNTIVRFVAKYKAEKDKKGEENFLATTMLIYFFISLFVLLFGFFFYGQIDGYFDKMNADQLQIAKTIFIILIFNLSISLPGGAFTGICLGYEQFVFPKAINIIRYLLRAIILVAILLLGGKAIALVILDTIFNILIIISTMTFVFKKLKVKFKLHKFSSVFVKQIFSYSVWIFIYGLVAQFQWRAGHIVLGGISFPEVLAIYAVGLMLGSYYGAFSSAITGVFLPRATQMTVSEATPEELTNMMIKIGRISFIVLIYILGAFILYGKQFVFLWVGETYHDAWVIGLMIMLAYTIPLVQGFTGSIIEAQNKVAFKSIVYLIFMSLGTLLGYFLAKRFGALGMISGSICGWVIAQNIMNIYYYRVLKLNLFRFFKELFYKTLPIQLIVMVLGYFINLFPGDGWLNFGLKSICYTLIFATLMYYFGIIHSEKLLVKNTINNLSKSIKK